MDYCDQQTFPDKKTVERVILTFDYTDALSQLPGVLLSSLVGTPTVAVVGGEDANPTNILDGAAVINIASTSVQLPIDRGVANVSYLITVLCNLSNGERYACPGTITVQPS